MIKNLKAGRVTFEVTRSRRRAYVTNVGCDGPLFPFSDTGSPNKRHHSAPPIRRRAPRSICANFSSTQIYACQQLPFLFSSSPDLLWLKLWRVLLSELAISWSITLSCTSRSSNSQTEALQPSTTPRSAQHQGALFTAIWTDVRRSFATSWLVASSLLLKREKADLARRKVRQASA